MQHRFFILNLQGGCERLVFVLGIEIDYIDIDR